MKLYFDPAAAMACDPIDSLEPIFYRRSMIKNVLIITLFVFLGCIVPALFLLPAQYLGVDLSKMAGADFEVTMGTVIAVLVFSLVSIGFVYVVQRYYHRRPFLDLGFKREWVWGLTWGHLVGFSLAGLTIGLGWTFDETLKAADLQFSSSVPASVSFPTLAGFYLFFLFMLTINSFKEELLFRSYAIENISGKTKSNWPVILIASAIFSAVHLVLEPPTWSAFISRFFFGVFTCQVYVVTRSIWPIVGIHNGSNWLGLTIGENWKMGEILTVTADNEPLTSEPIYGIISRGSAVLVMSVWMYRWSKGRGESEE